MYKTNDEISLFFGGGHFQTDSKKDQFLIGLKLAEIDLGLKITTPLLSFPSSKMFNIPSRWRVRMKTDHILLFIKIECLGHIFHFIIPV